MNKPTSPLILDLFPPVTPYSSGFLAVDDIHTLYWEQSGNPDGVPVLFLHGGPGAGATPTHRRFFDPDYYRIIIFDQRGSGRSHPLGSLKHNTTAHLLEDIEALRKHLGVERWHLFGGSWGSTLALRYAALHPEYCLSLVLRGIFLCTQEEIDWFLYGMRTIFPEAWDKFSGFLPQEERENILRAYYERLTAEDTEVQIKSAIRWTAYESACASLYPNPEVVVTDDQKQHAGALARIEAHYFMHEAIAQENSILNSVDTFRHIPSIIIQGRYDIICPIKTADNLHKAWPEAEYIVVPDAGHSALDPPLQSCLIEAMEKLKKSKKE